MILELDLGNTYCKWRILNDANNHIVSRGLGERPRWLSGEFPDAWQTDILRVRIASVLDDQNEQLLNTQLESHLHCPVRWVRSESYCAGVRNSYAIPERLGVDRWLGMVAAYQDARDALLVCDIGSALTIDLIDAHGLHKGGYIIPGPRLMGEALKVSTDRVRFDESELRAEVDPGTDTTSCVGSGIAAALSGAAYIAYRRAVSLIDGPVTLYITGGYRQALAQNLRAVGLDDLRCEAELVLDGLRWAAP